MELAKHPWNKQRDCHLPIIIIFQYKHYQYIYIYTNHPHQWPYLPQAPIGSDAAPRRLPPPQTPHGADLRPTKSQFGRGNQVGRFDLL